MSKLILGTKYYRYDENDNIEILRIYKYNDLEVKLFDDGNKEIKKKMTIEDLEKNYVKLNSHAIINFCIAKVGNDLDDVIVTVHKMSDILSNEPTPYCVCRQNITDIFANQLKTIKNANKMYVGCCMSLDTCPPDIDYRIMIACNKIGKCINVDAYMDDTLDDIIGLIKTNDFDRALISLFTDHINYEVKTNPTLSMMKNRLMNLESYDGYCKSLRTLLEQNNFMYDFYQAFGIIPINSKVTYDKDGVVSKEISDIISNIYQINIVSTLCMEYWYDIDLEEITNDYVLIIDSENKLFVIAYISNGPKHINIENVESEENIERLANSTIGNNRSIAEAANHIRINKNKYN